MRLKDKVAIVTGAGSSIGQESAILFANEGARVIIAEINDDAGQETAERIGKNALFVRIDVSSWDDTQRMVKIAVDHFGGLDILFNNAGLFSRSIVCVINCSKLSLCAFPRKFSADCQLFIFFLKEEFHTP